MRVSVRFDP